MWSYCWRARVIGLQKSSMSEPGSCTAEHTQTLLVRCNSSSRYFTKINSENVESAVQSKEWWILILFVSAVLSYPSKQLFKFGLKWHKYRSGLYMGSSVQNRVHVNCYSMCLWINSAPPLDSLINHGLLTRSQEHNPNYSCPHSGWMNEEANPRQMRPEGFTE